MGQTTATEIEQLWAQFYSAGMTDVAAAGLQLAIWELIAKDPASQSQFSPSENFYIPSGQTGKAGQAIALAGSDLLFLQQDPSAPTANLIALTNPNGQDYVIACVPDGGTTLALLGIGFLGLLGFRKVIEAKPSLSRIRAR